ncbi:hypothetical protein PGQ11_007921 [Apiospora arundinis]|uniref:Uncharacterized protein n=1 Tax=Apiospora arundinis TaxID=335852 RepID=A0ABR2IXE9_9PEZI
MVPNRLALAVDGGAINLSSTPLLLYKSRCAPPPKHSRGIVKCGPDVSAVFCRSLDKSAAQLERKNIALLDQHHSL